jgi:hypothetical protein
LTGRFTPRGKSPRYSLHRRLGGPRSRSGRYGGVKILDPAGSRSPRPYPVAIPTALPRLEVNRRSGMIYVGTIAGIYVQNANYQVQQNNRIQCSSFQWLTPTRPAKVYTACHYEKQQYLRKSGDVVPRFSNFGTGCRDELYASPVLTHGENERPVTMG